MTPSEPTPADRPVIAGVAAALVTLFLPDGAVDVPATAGHARRLVDAGVQGIVVAGSTGEAAALSEVERIMLLEAVRDAVPAGIPVVAGTGAPSARQAAGLTRDAVGAGVDAVLALSPPHSRDLPGYYKEVAAAAAGVPVLAYHFPAVSQPGVPVEELAALPVRGIKDSSDDPSRLLAECTTYPGEVYVGSPAVLPLAHALGAAGAILALANVEPQGCVAAFSGDLDAWRALVPAHLRARQQFPGALKQMVAERYGTAAVARLA